MRRFLLCGALAAALATPGAAVAQDAATKDLLKGKMREGLYEVKSDVDLSGVPGIPKEAATRSETRQRCLGKKDIERGVEPGKDCKVKSSKGTETGAVVVMECRDGSVTEARFSFAPAGFVSEMRTSGKQDGKPFVSVFRSQAKYLGACPAADPPPKK